MIISPIIPIWLMIIISVIYLIFISRNLYTFLRQLLIIALIFVINLRIMIPKDGQEVMSTDLEVLFVVDNTISMIAEDYNGNGKRMDAVKKDVAYIIKELPGARFSAITFNNTSQVLVPFSTDANMCKNSINTLNGMSDLYARGSSLNTPLKDIEKQLENAKERNSDKKRILFFISDGEITDDSKLESYSSLKDLVVDGAVLRLWY